MITVRKRVIAMLCCITLLVTGLYVAEPAQAQAAESSGTMTITTTEYGLSLPGSGFKNDNGYMNLEYTTTVTDYKSNGQNFLDADFAEKYITFDGGMTYQDLVNGMVSFYVATNNILQLNWANRTEAFTPGWSFTIAKGALLPYVNTAGATGYMALDREYTIRFNKANADNQHVVKIDSLQTTTFSLGKLGIWGNGKQEAGENIVFDATNTSVSGYKDTRTQFQTNEEYKPYFQLGDLSFEQLKDNVVIQYILSGSDRCIQITDWGSLRESMTAGDQLIFYKGFPIYYTDTAGTNWRATLDDTYVYECTGSNQDNTQVFYGTKLSQASSYGLATNEWKLSDDNGKKFVNVSMVNNTNTSTTKVYSDIMKDKVAEKYIQIGSYTVKEAADLGISILYIPTENVLQFQFSAKAQAALEVGDTIRLQKGMPVVYMDGSTLKSAVLDEDYVLTVTVNSDSEFKITSTLAGGEYGIDAKDLSKNEESNKDMYWEMRFSAPLFADANGEFQGTFSNNKELLSKYFVVKGKTAEALQTTGWHLRRYHLTNGSYQRLRFYCPAGKLDLKDQDYVILRKGLPISYTTTDGRTKVITLDKDYGYVYNAETQGFRYDASIEWTEASPEYKLENETVENLFVNTGDTTGAKRTNLIFTPAENVTLSKVWCNPLEDETIKTYIAFQGSQYTDINAFVKNGGDMIFYPNAKAIQIVWGAAWDKIAVGDYFTFKKGMPMPISDTEEMVLNADVSYVVEEKSADKVKLVRYDEVGTWALHTQIMGITSKVRETNVQALDVETRQNTIFSDVSGNKYDWLDDDRVKTYVDFAGWSVEKMHEVGVKFAIIKTATDQVFQIQWGGNKDQLPALGEKITFKKGLSFIYTTTENTKKRLTLDRDYVFQVAGSRNWRDNVRTLECANPEDGGTISMTSGQTGYWVGKSNNNCYVYADLNGTIKASENTDPFELDYETLPRYLQVGNVKGDTYLNNGITAKIINEQGTYKINIYWKDDILKVGEKVTLKKDFPILITGTDGITTKYQLDTDYSFTIHDGSADSNNATGLVFTSAKLTTDYQLGDLDGDYLLNANDVELLRKQIVGLLQVENRVSNMDNDYNGNLESTDLVRFKKQLQGKEAEEETYTTIYRNCAGVVTLKKGETLTYEVNKEIGNQNYVRLTFTTTENLTGQFTYSGTKGGRNTTGTEDFYLGFEEIQFEQFLDNYRSNGLNITDKTLQTITLTNVSDRDAQVQLCEVEVADRTVKTDDMLYLKDDSLKIGVDLNMGGTLAYLASLKYMPTEELNSNGDVVIDHTKKATEEVNLINVYDFGRQVQQSYYINVADTSYKHGKYNDKTWPYNPVQAGDKNHNHSQVIDYRMVNREDCKLIYIKVRAMDWAQNGKTTKSYMESWYQIKENLLYVDNAFVNWEGFQTVTSPHTQELPACYVAQSFDKLVTGNTSYDKQFTTWGNWNDEAENHGPFEADKTPTGSQAPVADWYAWVNDKNTEDKSQDFGVGLYIPNTTGCVAGRVFRSRGKDVTEKINSSWKDTYANRGAADAPILSKGLSYLNAMQKTEYQNAFVYNTSYTAPMVNAILKDYTSYEYTYVLTADTLDQMETNFNGLKDTVTNEVLLNWNH